MRKRVYSGTKWEKQVAYCRAVRVRDMIFVSGTTAVNENGEEVGKGDIAKQTQFIFDKIRTALLKLGASMSDVVRTRMYMTNMSLFNEMSKVHSEVFEGIDPAATCVEVKGLIGKNLLIEIEVDAVIT